MQWKGVMPAITTPFDEQLKVDHEFIARHARWLCANGCTGIVCLGSLGEAATLTFDEKIAILRTAVAAVPEGTPVVAAVSALSTAEAVALARAAAEEGAQGLMILPPYVYKGDWREMKAHIAAILKATPLPAMLYNNPVAYGTDFVPEQIEELAHEFANLAAVKESSTDVRRVTAIRALTGERLAIFVGVDDAIVEGIEAGAVGWIAGLVNAFPRESVDLFELASAGRKHESQELYRLVSAAAAHGHGAEVRAAYQADAAGGRSWMGARSPAAACACRTGNWPRLARSMRGLPRAARQRPA